MHRTHAVRSAAALLALVLGGCSSATEPEAVSATIREVTLTAEANAAWPSTPTVAGGATVTVRGIGAFGCGSPTVAAVRSGADVTVTVGVMGADRPCAANQASWRPYEAALAGLGAGRYTVRAHVVGYTGEARWVVNVLAND